MRQEAGKFVPVWLQLTEQTMTHETLKQTVLDDRFMIRARGPAEDVQLAEAILDTFNLGRIDVHKQAKRALPVAQVD